MTQTQTTTATARDEIVSERKEIVALAAQVGTADVRYYLRGYRNWYPSWRACCQARAEFAAYKELDHDKAGAWQSLAAFSEAATRLALRVA